MRKLVALEEKDMNTADYVSMVMYHQMSLSMSRVTKCTDHFPDSPTQLWTG